MHVRSRQERAEDPASEDIARPRALGVAPERLSLRADLRAGLRATAARTRVAAARFAATTLRRLWPPGSRHCAAIFAAGVVALGFYGMFFYSTLPERLPTTLDWRSASTLLARDARPGDTVALAPWWAERAREVLPASLPVMAFPRLAGEDLVGVRRVWLLSLPRAPGHRLDVEVDLAARASAVVGPERLGGLEVTRYDLRTPVVPLAFLPDRLATATVSIGERSCARDARGLFRCPASPFSVVAREVREVDSLPRPCLCAHPPPEPGVPLTITFPAVPLGRTLRGHTGIAGEAASAGKGSIRLSVKLDEEDVGETEQPPAGPGWQAFQLDTSRQAGRVGAVKFTVTAAKVDRRDLCFDAYILPE